MKLLQEFEITRIQADQAHSTLDQVITEHNLTLFVNDRHFTDLPCTPDDLDALVYGHLFSHGMIQKKGDLINLSINENRAEAVIMPKPSTSHVDQSSTEVCLSAEELFSTVKTFARASPLFTATGGVHSCALHLGKQRIFMEDIGRHNAVDKALGKALLENRELSQAFLITSGRVSSQLITKALFTGLRVIISCGAPTDQAVHLARGHNITLCGFARGRRVNIYSAPQRISIPN